MSETIIAETIAIRKQDLEQLRESLLSSLELLEELEFQQGVTLGREQFKAGKSISLEEHKARKNHY